MATITPAAAGGGNVCNFLDLIAWSELKPAMMNESGADGYNLIVGSMPGRLIRFSDYSDHPRRMQHLIIKGQPVNSSAAGRYQFIAPTWDGCKRILALPDFSPISQDRAAIELLRECGALPLIIAGKIEDAIHAANKIWASFPGAGANQNENAMSMMLARYTLTRPNYPPDFSNVVAGSASA